MSIEADVPGADAVRAIAVLTALTDGLAGLAGTIPEPALAGPLGYFADAIGSAARMLGREGRACAASERMMELIAQAGMLLERPGLPSASDAEGLRETIAALVGASHAGAAGADEIVQGLLEQLTEIETGAAAATGPAAGAAGPARLGPGAVSAYLRRRFDDPDALADAVTYVGGGYSKHTILVSGVINGEHREIVLRQVPAGQPEDTLVPEYEVLRHVFSPGLPIAEPLWIEPAAGELGGPFFASAKAHGSTLGSVEGAHGSVPESFCEDLAGFLAELHRIDVAGLRAMPVPSMRTPDEISAAIDEMEGRVAAERVSPRLAAVLAWLRVNVPDGGETCVVHGDVGLHNCLAESDRLSAVLDWERAHLGDPTEDLAYLRPSIEPVYSWSDFLDRYVAAGGRRPDPDVERFYTVWQDTWRHIECVRLGEDFFGSGSVEMLIAGFVLGPRFLESALKTAFGARAAHLAQVS